MPGTDDRFRQCRRKDYDPEYTINEPSKMIPERNNQN
jgi:hypothetical protein